MYTYTPKPKSRPVRSGSVPDFVEPVALRLRSKVRTIFPPRFVSRANTLRFRRPVMRCVPSEGKTKSP